MLFCQLGGAKSLREICGGLAASEGKLRHLGLPEAPPRSTLSYANEHRPVISFHCGKASRATKRQLLVDADHSIGSLDDGRGSRPAFRPSDARLSPVMMATMLLPPIAQASADHSTQSISICAFADQATWIETAGYVLCLCSPGRALPDTCDAVRGCQSVCQ